ncbi:GTA baseplate fiber-binding domain-containing protein [Erythrobacter sp. Alg231-14]|uniref:GTA baseplate fiber-binding domain-containing protein n=1 Tax=Erythrobacter sp. Alg231-14 TaxID=1922225 RepID=UPI000D54D09A
MATLILTAVGTAIGGPIGGALGAFIGQQADSAIFGGGNREGPRLRELSVTTSSYGQPLPRHFGRMRVAGTVIWSTELVETRSKSGGGKGKPSTTTYSYSASFAVALSSTPIDRIGRIWADGNLLRGASGDLKVDGIMRTYLGTGDNLVDPVIAADRGANAPGFRDCAYLVFEDLQLGDFGNRIPALTFEVFAADDSSVSLGQLIPQTASVSGDVTLQNARGFSDEGGALGSSLAAIDRVFPITCVTTANGLSFAASNTLPSDVAVLPAQLSDKDSGTADERHKRRGDILDKEPLAVRYYDEDRDYQPGVQRALGLRPEGREAIVDLPAAMTAEGARQLANSNANRARWNDEQIIWRIGELDPNIGPGSVVRMPNTNGFWLIKSWEWFDRGIELSLERLAPQLGAEIPSDAGSSNVPLDLTAPQTLLTAVEVPPDSASDTSTPLLFAATSASSIGWRGAALFVEQGNTLNEIGLTGSDRSVFGTLATPLPGSACTLFEPESAVEIQLPAADLSFASSDMTGLAMGENRLLVADEVIQFLHAEMVSGGYWRLSGLLRGRAGTEFAAFDGHEAGATTVLLDDRLTILDPSLVPSTLATRIAAIGRGDEDPVFAGLQNVGLSLRPPSPVHSQTILHSNNELELCWTRRARGQWNWTQATEVPLIEESENYTVSFGPPDAPHVSWVVTEPRFSLSDAEQSGLVAQYGHGPIWARQLGTFGQSNPLYLTAIN